MGEMLSRDVLVEEMVASASNHLGTVTYAFLEINRFIIPQIMSMGE